MQNPNKPIETPFQPPSQVGPQFRTLKKVRAHTRGPEEIPSIRVSLEMLLRNSVNSLLQSKFGNGTWRQLVVVPR